jgi:hypothetical protein
MDRVTAIIWGLIGLGAIFAPCHLLKSPAPHCAMDRRSSRGVLPGENVKSASSVSGREPSPAANFSEDNVLLANRRRLLARY